VTIGDLWARGSIPANNWQSERLRHKRKGRTACVTGAKTDVFVEPSRQGIIRSDFQSYLAAAMACSFGFNGLKHLAANAQSAKIVTHRQVVNIQ